MVSLVYEGNGQDFAPASTILRLDLGTVLTDLYFWNFIQSDFFSTCEKKIVCIAKNDLKIQKEKKNIQHKKTDIYS